MGFIDKRKAHDEKLERTDSLFKTFRPKGERRDYCNTEVFGLERAYVHDEKWEAISSGSSEGTDPKIQVFIPPGENSNILTQFNIIIIKKFYCMLEKLATKNTY